MSIPKAVDAAEAASDEALQALLDPPVPSPEPAPGEGEAPAPETPPASDPSKELKDQVEQMRRQLDYEKHRNDSLQGRLESQLRPANEELRRLREELDELKKAKAVPAGPAHARHLKPGEAESVGSETLDLQARVARGEAEAAVERSRADVDKQMAQMREEQLRAAEERAARSNEEFWAKVETLSPGIKTLNDTDADWHRWLDSMDPVSGRTFREIGETALRAGDARRLAYLVTEYKDATGKGKPPVDVSDQVRPGVTKGGGQPRPAAATSKPVVRESAMKKFYDDLARGKYRGREAEADKIERQIELAIQEGRMIPG